MLKLICADIIQKLGKRFDPDIAQAKFPVDYKNSMNTVLQQEIVRYNNLHKTIIQSLKDIELALKGLVVLSEQLETQCRSLLLGLVPDAWKKNSYPSLKPLASYINDLTKRLKYF